MSFKRDGDDYSALNLVKKRRVEELLSKDIPEDEACLLNNGRFTCLVCSSRPVLDTIDMLCVHRNGKKHSYCAEHFFRKKREFHQLVEKRRQEALNNHENVTKSTELEPPLILATRKATQNSLLRYAPYNPVSSGAQSGKNACDVFKTNPSKNKGFFEYTRNVLTNNASREGRKGSLINPLYHGNSRSNEGNIKHPEEFRQDKGTLPRRNNLGVSPAISGHGTCRSVPPVQLSQNEEKVLLRPYVSKRRRGKLGTVNVSRNSPSQKAERGESLNERPGSRNDPRLQPHMSGHRSMIDCRGGHNASKIGNPPGRESSEDGSDDDHDWEPITEIRTRNGGSEEGKEGYDSSIGREDTGGCGKPKKESWLGQSRKKDGNCEDAGGANCLTSHASRDPREVQHGQMIRRVKEPTGPAMSVNQHESMTIYETQQHGYSDQAAERGPYDATKEPPHTGSHGGRLKRQNNESSEEMVRQSLDSKVDVRVPEVYPPHEVVSMAAEGRCIDHQASDKERCPRKRRSISENNFNKKSSQSNKYARASDSHLPHKITFGRNLIWKEGVKPQDYSANTCVTERLEESGEVPKVPAEAGRTKREAGSSSSGEVCEANIRNMQGASQSGTQGGEISPEKRAPAVKFSVSGHRIGMQFKESRDVPGGIKTVADVHIAAAADGGSEDDITTADPVHRPKVKKSREKNKTRQIPSRYSEERRTQLEKHLELTSSGWVRDPSGKWIRDENVEFDSDEEPPD